MRNVAAGVVVLSLLGAVGAAGPAFAAGDPQIRTLSNRADLISAGDALVQVVLPAGAKAANLRVDVDGRDVTRAFAVRPDGRDLGLLTGLHNGDNVVTATLPGDRGAQLPIVHHPIRG